MAPVAPCRLEPKPAEDDVGNPVHLELFDAATFSVDPAI
jgi:hypothetical protein